MYPVYPAMVEIHHVRLGRMELRLGHASELLPAFIAHHAPRYLAFFECCGLDAGICFFVRRSGADDFFEGLVLVVFEPLEGSLYCPYASALKIYDMY
jgi:hypothetical protein